MVQPPRFTKVCSWQRALYPTVLLMSIYFASGQSSLASPQFNWLLFSDKIAHFCIFGLLATLILRIPLQLRSGAYAPLITAILVSGLGGLDEWRQSFTPGRQVEWADWGADSLGAILACILYQYAPFYRRMLEWKLTSKPRSSAKHSRIDSDDAAI